MRTYTLVFSIVVHVCVVCAVIVTTLTAADTLPQVRRALDFVEVTAAAPAPPPAPVRPSRTVPTAPAPYPIDAPTGISEEPPLPPATADIPFGNIVMPEVGLTLPEPAPEPPPVAPSRPPLRVGGIVRPPQRLVTIAPVYPDIARKARIEGVVLLEAVIGEDGVVRDLRPLRPNAWLDQAAMDAVRQWRFTPTLLNGEPTPVVMTITVTFSLR
jgi:protein TonB